jgi:hypothetical protein
VRVAPIVEGWLFLRWDLLSEYLLHHKDSIDFPIISKNSSIPFADPVRLAPIDLWWLCLRWDLLQDTGSIEGDAVYFPLLALTPPKQRSPIVSGIFAP